MASLETMTWRENTRPLMAFLLTAIFVVALVSTDQQTSTLLPHSFWAKLQWLIRIDDVDRHFKNAVKETDPLKKTFLQTGAYGSKTLNKITHPAAKPPQLNGVTFREITSFDDRIDAFYEKVRPHYNFIVEKRMRYMNWRYCDRRGGDYKIWIAEKEGEIVGYLVLRVNRIDADYPEGYVMDLLALNGRDDVAENLVKFAVDYFHGMGVNVAHAQLIGGHFRNM